MKCLEIFDHLKNAWETNLNDHVDFAFSETNQYYKIIWHHFVSTKNHEILQNSTTPIKPLEN